MIIDNFAAFTVAIIVYFVGVNVTRRVRFLREFNIPEPVSGGLVAACVTLILHAGAGLSITFELDTRDLLLVYFFTTIGLNAKLSDLIQGGRPLALLLALTIGYIVIQNLVGVVGATLFGMPSPVGVLAGSASLIGGHGTAIAWAPRIAEQFGITNALEVGVAAATFGLILASLIGGPIARFLIDRDQLQAAGGDSIVGLPYEDGGDAAISHFSLLRSLLAIHVAIVIGYYMNEALQEAGLKLPLFVSCLLVGIVMSNTLPFLFPKMIWPARTRALAVISDLSLNIFLTMSLMSMQLWTLAGLAGPLIGILAIQTVAAVLFILFILYRVMGSDYEAAVLSAGFGGFALGATPTAVANMTAVTKKHGPAPNAFIILPLVAAFFVDLANSVIIGAFLG